MNSTVRLNYVVALSAEAHPLIGYYKLKRLHNISAFEVYENESVRLIVGGMGKANAAAATAYLAGLFNTRAPQVWINVGIAGGNAANLGDVVIVNAITDAETGKSYYPSICFDSSLPQTAIVTVSDPGTKYRQDSLFDMESAGFFVAANRFAPAELVHCCKIVSDNSDKSVDTINKTSVIEMVQAGLEKIDVVAQKAMELAKDIGANESVESIFKQISEKHHFSESQKHTLRLYLQNWLALMDDTNIQCDDLLGAKDAKSVLITLQKTLSSMPVSY